MCQHVHKRRLSRNAMAILLLTAAPWAAGISQAADFLERTNTVSGAAPAKAPIARTSVSSHLSRPEPGAPVALQTAPGVPAQGMALDGTGTPRAVVPSLPGLLEMALSHDANINSQRLQSRARAEDVPKARAGLLPQIDFTYGYSYTDSDNIYTDGDVSSCANNPETGELLGGEDFERRCRGYSTDNVRQIQLSQPLFSMERIRQLQRAGEQREAAELQLAVAERDLVLNTAEAYMNAFYTSRQVDLLQGKREALDLQLTQAQRAFDLGIGDRIDLLAARSRHDQSGADIASAENDYNDALSRLERLTGVSPDFAQFSLNELTDIDFARPPALQTLEPDIAQNVEVQLALQQLEVARADHDVRRSAYYPEVSLNLSWMNRNSDDPYRESEDKRAGVQASMNLFRGGYTSADVRQGDLLRQAGQADVDNARRQAIEELRQRHRGIDGDITRLEALAQSIRSSELYLEAADRGAALGLRDLVDVLDARADLYDQRIAYVDAFRRLVLDRLSLLSATGRLGSTSLTDTMGLIGQLVAPPRSEADLPVATRQVDHALQEMAAGGTG